MVAVPFIFDNGVGIAAAHLHRSQIKRYAHGMRLHEPFEELWFELLLFEASAGDQFLNIGAAAGYYSLLALRQRPRLRVVAVNPHPTFRAMLRANAALAGINVTDATSLGEATKPAPGGILQLPYAVENASSTRMLLGDGWGDGLHATLSPKRLASGSGRGGKPRNPAHVRTARMEDLVRTVCQLGPKGSPCSILLANWDIQGHEETVFADEGTQRVLASHCIKRVIVGSHGCDYGGRVVRCADFGPRAAARHGCNASRPNETKSLGQLLRGNSSECGRAHGVVLRALRRAGYRILYQAERLPGQPDGLIVGISPRETPATAAVLTLLGPGFT